MQVVQALKYLHANKVIHRDLKLGNLFLGDNMTLKLGDFGLATKIEFEGEKKKTICGTPNYIAPEILEGKDGHSYEVDMWSLGVILYTLLIGKVCMNIYITLGKKGDDLKRNRKKSQTNFNAVCK